MNPSNMTAAQLLDATIEATVDAGLGGLDPRMPALMGRAGEPCCVVGRAQIVTGIYDYGVVTQDPRVQEWYGVSQKLFGTIVPVLAYRVLNDEDFGTLISQLRQIKSML